MTQGEDLNLEVDATAETSAKGRGEGDEHRRHVVEDGINLCHKPQHCNRYRVSGRDSLPDAESSFYFSGVTYTTLGYGDLVLPQEWRLLGPVEGLTGILMCGLSTGFFFAVVSRFLAAKSAAEQD
jgi:hypothetical protein